jgi:hypothetical protein
VKVQPFQEGEMGWGLKSIDFVQKGALVIEYLGEVINEEEMQVSIFRNFINFVLYQSITIIFTATYALSAYIPTSRPRFLYHGVTAWYFC